MMNAVAICLRKYITFSGRATRAEYWWFMLFIMVLDLVAIIIVSATGLSPLVSILVVAATWLPAHAVGWRRLQDAGFPGYLVFTPLLALPILGLAIATNEILILYLARAVGGACGAIILVISLLPSEPTLTA